MTGLTLPIELAVVPICYLLCFLGMADSGFALMLVYAATGIPFSVFILAAFFHGLPRDLQEAAASTAPVSCASSSGSCSPWSSRPWPPWRSSSSCGCGNDFFFPLSFWRQHGPIARPAERRQEWCACRESASLRSRSPQWRPIELQGCVRTRHRSTQLGTRANRPSDRATSNESDRRACASPEFHHERSKPLRFIK